MRDGTTKIFDTDEHPRRGTTMEKLASLKPLHPEIEDFPITAGNASGLNDAAAAMMIVSSDYAKAQRPQAARQDRVVGVGRRAAARHRPRPDRRDPEGARARRPRRSPTSTSPRSTRRSRRCRSPRAASSASREDITNAQRLGLLARSPGRGHRRPHDHHDDVRAASARRRHRPREHVRGWRHGLGDGVRGLPRLTLRRLPVASSKTGSGAACSSRRYGKDSRPRLDDASASPWPSRRGRAEVARGRCGDISTRSARDPHGHDLGACRSSRVSRSSSTSTTPRSRSSLTCWASSSSRTRPR